MTPNLVYVIVIGVMFGAGVTLLLERTLTRVLIGVVLISNGINVLILMGGEPGAPPIVGDTTQERMSDSLPQAMILTAIVITLGIVGFLLAISYRSWQLLGHDEVQDDVEDRRIMDLAERDESPHSKEYDSGDSDDPPTPVDDVEPGRPGL